MISPIMPTYARYDFTFEKGDGVYVYSTDGKRYLDFGAGIAVSSLGHCHPHLVKALKKQAERLWHTSNLYHIPGQENLARRLVDRTFADTVFFNNSGNEAVELGFKMIRRYQAEIGHPERYKIISLTGAFHGRSFAGIAAGKQEKHINGFGPMMDGFDQVGLGGIERVELMVNPKTAGIVIEPIQGEGGIRCIDDGYLRGLREICDKNSLVLLFDEVQTGVGRTGKFYCHEWSGVEPDILSSAKGLGGGFPIGATMATEKIASAMGPGTHGSTFGGNPLAMACANAVLDVILENGFLEHVVDMSERLKSGLENLVTKFPNQLMEIRGKGLLLGLKCRGDSNEAANLVAEASKLGLLSVPAGENVVRIIPPLVLEKEHVDEAIEIIDRALTKIAMKKT